MPTLSSLYPGETLSDKLRQYSLQGIGRLFKGLYGTITSKPMEPLLNLFENDDETTYSLKKLYLKHWSDPTEVTFVDTELGGRWDLWQKMCEHKEISAYISTLREEARARYLSNNFKALHELAETGDAKTRMSTLKFLCTSILADTKTSDRGRPSKKEIQQRTNEILQEDKELQEAFARVVSLEDYKAG